MTRRKDLRGRRWAVAAAAVVLGGGMVPASAADLGGDCCADLEERIAELEATTARKGNRKVKLEVSGLVNEALLFWDDGDRSDVYVGTNDAARTRFRFKGEGKITDDLKAGYLLEIGVRANRLNRTDQFNDNGITNNTTGGESANVLDVRHSTWFLSSKTYGKLYVGKTDQATERITEVNTVNTSHFLKHYGRWNGSLVLRLKNGSTGTGAYEGYAIRAGQDPTRQNGATSANFRTWGNILPQSGQSGEGVPGEGDRWNLVRVETPEFEGVLKGFSVSAAWGEDDFWDAAVRYTGEQAGFKFAGGIGYGDYAGTGSLNDRGCAIDASGSGTAQNAGGKADCQTLGLSGSIQHVETGLFVSGAYGIKWDRNRQDTFDLNVAGAGAIDDEDSFYYVQAGIERKFNSLGKTTIYGEYEHYDTGAGISGSGLTATGRPASFNQNNGFARATGFLAGADIDVWGFGINQQVDSAALDLYLGYRYSEADLLVTNNGSRSGGAATTYEVEGVHLVMTGAQIKF